MNQHVSREVAVKLKEAGFDVPTITYFSGKRKEVCFFNWQDNHNFGNDISAPDYLTAARWIWEKSGKVIDITMNGDGTAFWILEAPEGFDTYDLALLAALDELKAMLNE